MHYCCSIVQINKSLKNFLPGQNVSGNFVTRFTPQFPGLPRMVKTPGNSQYTINRLVTISRLVSIPMRVTILRTVTISKTMSTFGRINNLLTVKSLDVNHSVVDHHPFLGMSPRHAKRREPGNLVPGHSWTMRFCEK